MLILGISSVSLISGTHGITLASRYFFLFVSALYITSGTNSVISAGLIIALIPNASPLSGLFFIASSMLRLTSKPISASSLILVVQ